MKKNYLLYKEGLAHLEGISLFPFNVDAGEVPQWVDACVSRRDELDEHLSSKNVICRKFWLPLHTHAPYRLPDDGFPNSTKQVSQALWLPSAFSLSDDDIGNLEV